MNSKAKDKISAYAKSIMTFLIQRSTTTIYSFVLQAAVKKQNNTVLE